MAIIRRDNDDDEGALTLTSLMDLVFLLLIFFIVTASLKKPQKVLPIQLQQASQARDVRLGREVVISVTQEGDRYIHDDKQFTNQAPVGRGTLNKFLSDLATEYPDRNIPIRLDIDRRTPYFQIMDVIDNLELYQFRNVYLRGQHGVTDEKE